VSRSESVRDGRGGKWINTDVIGEDDPGKAFRVPEELVDIVITNDVVMVLLPSHELAIDNLKALISYETVERLDDSPEIESLRDWIYALLALR
jgi:hypothetical protein